MKFKPTGKPGGVAIELEPQERQLPLPEETGKPMPVFQLKKILVPVDFSDCSKKALAYAIPLAEQFRAEITLLHVVPTSPTIPEMGPVDAISVEESRQQLESFRRTINRSIRSQVLLRSERLMDPHVVIINVAKELAIDLIVIATHGRTGLLRVLMGSTAEKVIRQAGCPVLVVREHEHDFIASERPGESVTPL